MRVHVDIDMNGTEVNFQYSEEREEYHFLVDAEVRKYWEAMQLLDRVYQQSKAGLSGMHDRAVQAAELHRIEQAKQAAEAKKDLEEALASIEDEKKNREEGEETE